MSTTGSSAAAEEQKMPHSIEAQLKHTVAKLRKDESRSTLKDLGDHFFYLDNKIIEFYCGTAD